MKRAAIPALLLTLAAAVQAGSLPEYVVKRVTSACVLIHVSSGPGQQGAAGSGFFVSRNEIVTNEHVIKPALEGNAGVKIIIKGGSQDRALADATVVAADEELDLALLRTEARAPYILRFLSDRSLKMTMPIWVAGFPFGTQPGLEITLNTGTVSALRRDEKGDLVQVQLNADVNPGNSGGPVVDSAGRVIGVSRATIDPKVGHGIALAIPSGAIQDFVRAAQRVRHRSGRLRVSGRTSRPGLRVVGAEKAEEAWGISVTLTVRGDRDSDEAMPFVIEVLDRRRDVLKRDAVVPENLEPRKEATYTIRLKGPDYNDVSSCRILD